MPTVVNLRLCSHLTYNKFGYLPWYFLSMVLSNSNLIVPEIFQGVPKTFKYIYSAICENSVENMVRSENASSIR